MEFEPKNVRGIYIFDGYSLCFWVASAVVDRIQRVEIGGFALFTGIPKVAVTTVWLGLVQRRGCGQSAHLIQYLLTGEDRTAERRDL